MERIMFNPHQETRSGFPKEHVVSHWSFDGMGAAFWVDVSIVLSDSTITAVHNLLSSNQEISCVSVVSTQIITHISSSLLRIITPHYTFQHIWNRLQQGHLALSLPLQFTHGFVVPPYSFVSSQKCGILFWIISYFATFIATTRSLNWSSIHQYLMLSAW